MVVMRVLGALCLIVVAIPASAVLHSHHESRAVDLRALTSHGSAFVPPGTVKIPYRPWWDDPAAVLVVLLGVGGAVALLWRDARKETP